MNDLFKQTIVQMRVFNRALAEAQQNKCINDIDRQKLVNELKCRMQELNDVSELNQSASISLVSAQKLLTDVLERAKKIKL